MSALTSAQRARLHGERQRRGLSVLTVVVDLNRLTEMLMDDNRIGPDVEDQRIIEDAVADVLDEYANTATRDARRRAGRGIFKS